MYKRMYGLPKYHGQTFSVLPKPPSRSAEAKLEKSIESEIEKSVVSDSDRAPVTYAFRPRRWPRPEERDCAVWEGLLGAESLEKLEKLKAEQKAALPPRLDEESLAPVKVECLLVEDIDLHVKENAETHHTDLFECTDRDDDPQLVVRRGQEFKLTLTFQRPWSSKDDDMHLIFKLGDEPNPNKGTFVSIKLEEGKDTGYMTGPCKEWGARILSQSDNTLTVSVFIPPDVIVGEWEYTVRTVKVKDGEVKEYECEGPDDVIILLNPWCKDDQVYMENTKELNEYILNQVGLVFCGSSKHIMSKPWIYDQFFEGILSASLHLLRKANDFSVSTNMGDPVYLSRALSRILNNCDDSGVLIGRWDGQYEDGTRPTSWLGSAPIIKEYMETGQPVKYGQCWVFSHLLTTVARALGLPCRSVTNFSSAHDTDLTMTIDKYIDDDGDEVEYKNDDSVWNFHVWNEVWMHRPDLDKLTGQQGKYDGWHVVDATPQELSDSVFQCGPSPLEAIKQGDMHIGYDTKFIFAEVNAEYCIWENGFPPVLIHKDTNRVGEKISTKIPNGDFSGYYNGVDEGVRLDITNLYKYTEGSVAEREVVEKATRTGRLGHFLFKNKTDIQVTIEDQPERPRIGRDITVKVNVKNEGTEQRTVTLRTSVRPINYWGGLRGKEKIAHKLYDADTLEAGETKSFDLPVVSEDILRLCDESVCMKILALCRVEGFKEPVFESDELVLKTPGIKCTGPTGSVSVGETFDVELTLKNPLATRALTGCKLKIQGTMKVVSDGFTEKNARYSKDIEDLQPGEVRPVTVQVTPNPLPRHSFVREFNVGLETEELPDFMGVLHIRLG